ncbi:hypothetical protein BGZ59_007389 [Podila verticillata]|nr:hypothetical protein BGZ59_007389 [Podila verticillata]
MPVEILAGALDRTTQGISSPSSSAHPLHRLLPHPTTNISTNVPTYPTPTPTPIINGGGRNTARPHYGGVITADILSMSGSLAIILSVPRVIAQVPSQKKRMVLILLIAISNLGFSTSNIATDLGNASSKGQCGVAVWCYVFFQLLTSSLVIVATFRLCGVFLFKHKHTIPSKYIILNPILAFILATAPAIAGQYVYDECGRYCWFIDDVISAHDCKLQSTWAWACFYGWMVVFLGILFGSTLFVLTKIALMVMATRSNLKKVVNQSTFRATEQCLGIDPPQAHAPSSTLDRIRTMSHSITSRAASIFSFGSHEHPHHNAAHNNHEQQHELNNALDNHDLSDTLPKRVNIGDLSSLGLDSPTLRSEGILADVLPTTTPQHTVLEVPLSSMESGETIRARERPFLIAILRQALYPVSISLSGCVQIFVDLTLPSGNSPDIALSYAANFITSIQGFLFFAVFFFDPAVVKTRRHWRKYLVWKYYVEFYFSMGMLQEGNDFEVKFMEHCQQLSKRKPEVSWLMKPPSYSWSSQYDYDAMAPEFLTGPHVAPIEVSRKYRASHLPSPIPEEETEDQIKCRPPISDIDLSSRRHSHYFNHLLYDHGAGSPRVSSPRNGSPKNGKQKSTEPRDEEIKPEEDYTPYTYDTLQDPSGSSSSSSPNNASNDNRIHPMTTVEIAPPEQSPTEEINIDWDMDTRISPLAPRSPSISENGGQTRSQNRPKSLETRPSISLTATKPGDVLSLPQLARVRTIGGSDGTGRYRSRPSKTSSTKNTTFASSRISFAERLGLSVRGNHRDMALMVEGYQSAFRWPRGAYVMHILVRWILVPSSIRLAPIKRPPFRESVIQERKSSVDMIRSGSWNPSVLEALREVTVQPKKRVPIEEASGSTSSLSFEGGSNGDVVGRERSWERSII